MKPKILCIIDYYLPGFKGGGPTRTIANMVSCLSNDFDFWIITRDRDLNTSQPYNVVIDEWIDVNQAKVFYASPKIFTWLGFKKILKKTYYDILYINSFFSPQSTIFLLLLRRFGLISNKPIVIAPRGEFSVGALQLKSTKKKLYIAVAKFLRLYDGLIWQASSEHEAQDILSTMKIAPNKIAIAPNLLVTIINTNRKNAENKIKKHPVRIIFLSRISPMKNIDYLLRILQKVQLPSDLSIYGPLEDAKYWLECKELIRKLPTNITVKHKGELTPEEVSTAFMKHDVFFFPTRGENFGHVIFEALAVGTCVVLSDQTPWQQDENRAVETIPLDDTDTWIAALERWAKYSNEELNTQRTAALQYAHKYITTSSALEQNRQLFLGVLYSTRHLTSIATK